MENSHQISVDRYYVSCHKFVQRKENVFAGGLSFDQRDFTEFWTCETSGKQTFCWVHMYAKGIRDQPISKKSRSTPTF